VSTIARYGGLVWLLTAVLLHTDPATTGLVGVAAVLAGALLARLLAAPVAAPATLSGPSLRALSARSAVDSQRDPDAAGRPRPRAPSAGPAAA
jgi:hypothetical protein